MRLPELAVLYLLVGIGSAAGFLVVKRPLSAGSLIDAALLGTFWPLYGPFLLLKSEGPSGDIARDVRTSTAAVPSDLPLRSLLPDPTIATALEHRLSQAEERVEEIDRLLALPEFSEDAARSRERELELRGDHRAAAAAHRRCQSIGRLKQLRRRFSTELTEISEILVQARIQAEIVRLSGEDDGQDTRELISELHLRMEVLDEMLGEESHALAPRPPTLP